MGLDMYLSGRDDSEVAYWRKANAIHNWFVKNVQSGEDDCKTYKVSGKELMELKKLCSQVIRNRTKAEELLPTVDGFFFGETDYNEYYFKMIRYTWDRLKGIDPKKNYYYHSSW